MSLSPVQSQTFRRRLTPAVFVGVMLVFILVLGWLGLILVEQDADLNVQRRREQLDIDASQAVNSIDRSYHEALQSLSALHGDELLSIIESSVTVRLKDQRLEVYPDTAIRYRPFAGNDTKHEALQRADRLEFRRRDLVAATHVLTPFVDSADKSLRSGALLRLARLARKRGNIQGASDYYDRMTALSGALTDGIPATWIGLYGRCSLMEEANQADELQECGSRLLDALTAGTERAEKSTYAFYVQAASEWMGENGDGRGSASARTHLLSEAVLELASLYQDIIGGGLPRDGVRAFRHDTTAAIILWSADGQTVIGIAVHADQLLENWLGAAPSTSEISVLDEAGYLTASPQDSESRMRESRSVSVSNQRWTVLARETSFLQERSAGESRRAVLLAGLFVVIVIVAISAYYLSRAMQREMEVAQLQSDFVSAVSHEFRTPLTSMRQLTEMLADGRVRSPEKAAHYYRLLDQEARRLSSLVESLLNFARMESGTFRYHMTEQPVEPVVRRVVKAFIKDKERRVSISGTAAANARVDADMLELAIWNLLDNAAKYSEEGTAIAVEMASEEGKILISVSDEGPGIDEKEQERIFDKFVRAPKDEEKSAKGTGIGLALVSRIMHGHGGAVELTSSPGKGSTFTLILPIRDDPNTRS